MGSFDQRLHVLRPHQRGRNRSSRKPASRNRASSASARRARWKHVSAPRRCPPSAPGRRADHLPEGKFHGITASTTPSGLKVTKALGTGPGPAVPLAGDPRAGAPGTLRCSAKYSQAGTSRPRRPCLPCPFRRSSARQRRLKPPVASAALRISRPRSSKETRRQPAWAAAARPGDLQRLGDRVAGVALSRLASGGIDRLEEVRASLMAGPMSRLDQGPCRNAAAGRTHLSPRPGAKICGLSARPPPHTTRGSSGDVMAPKHQVAEAYSCS